MAFSHNLFNNPFSATISIPLYFALLSADYLIHEFINVPYLPKLGDGKRDDLLEPFIMFLHHNLTTHQNLIHPNPLNLCYTKNQIGLEQKTVYLLHYLE